MTTRISRISFGDLQRKWLAENPEEWHYPTVLKAELEIDVLQLDKP